LLLAGEHPVEFSADDTLARITALLDAGVRTFVNLTEQREKMQSYSSLVRTLAVERGVNAEVRRIPIPDRGVPPAETLRAILDVIDDSIANGNPVFVHCFAGVGRTGTIVGCYLQRHGLATAADVIARIAELRSQMPGGNEASPHTEEQVQIVKGWKTGA
jgi:protein-tyrosine phosphatase